MLKATLEAVGLRVKGDIPSGEIFSSEFDPSKYDLRQEDLSLISSLKNFVMQYNREIPVDTSVTVSDNLIAANLMRAITMGLDHEEVWVMFLNVGNRVISRCRMGEGDLKSSVVDSRRIVRKALDENADGVILCHNHPSGNPRPSAYDIKQTSRLRSQLKLFDIRLVDHLIMADSSFFSFVSETVSGFERG